MTIGSNKLLKRESKEKKNHEEEEEEKGNEEGKKTSIHYRQKEKLCSSIARKKLRFSPSTRKIPSDSVEASICSLYLSRIVIVVIIVRKLFFSLSLIAVRFEGEKSRGKKERKKEKKTSREQVHLYRVANSGTFSGSFPRDKSPEYTKGKRTDGALQREKRKKK